MRLNNGNNDEVISSNVISSKNFGFAANGKAFKVLSDTLYQNKIGSCVREISTNAMDSHIAAGTPDLPFEIHVPDTFEPWFSVKDFGIGLSQEAVFNVYTTLFLSTKDESNDMVGAFGLGSKTPFAYTDCFTINSIYNGELSTYSAMIGGDGTPTINLLNRVPTDAHNGVEIIIPVKNSDFQNFYKEVETQLMYFKVKPIIHNDRGRITFKPIEYVNSLPCGISFGRRVGMYDKIRVIQGGVWYPLNCEIIRKHIKDDSIFLNFVESQRSDLFFDIGEIEVTPSRETISYNEFTIKNILNKISTGAKELCKAYTDMADACASEFEKAKWFNALNISLLQILTKHIVFSDNYRVINNIAYLYFVIPTAMKKMKITKPDGTEVETSEILPDYQISLNYSLGTNDRITSRTVIDHAQYIAVDGTIIFAYAANGDSMNSRIRRYVLENMCKIYVFRDFNKNTLSDAGKDFWEKKLNIKLLNIDTLPKIERVRGEDSSRRAGYKIPKFWHLQINDVQYINKNSMFVPVTDKKLTELKEPTIYFVNTRMRGINIFVKNIKHKLPQVIIIREKDLPIVKNLHNFSPAEDFIKNELDAIQRWEVMHRSKLAYMTAITNGENMWECNKIFDAFNACDIPNMEKIVKLRRNIDRYKKYRQSVLSSYDPKVTKLSDKILNRIKNFYDRYPLLRYTDLSNAREQNIDALVEYVKMCEAAKTAI